MSRLGYFILTSMFMGCNALQPVEVVRVDGLSDLSISRGGIEGEVTLVLDNPNPVTIQAKTVDVAVTINGQEVGRVELPYAQSISKGVDQTLKLTVRTEPRALLSVLEQNWLQILQGKEVEVSLDGSVEGSALGIGVNIPVVSTQNMKIQL
jgi:LEA14-like dessication related protein